MSAFSRNVTVAWRRLRRSTRLRPAQCRKIRRIATVVVLAGVLCLAGAAIVLDVSSVEWGRHLGGTAIAFFRTITRWGQSDWMLISTAVSILVLLYANWTRVDRRSAAAWVEIGMILFFAFLAVSLSGLLCDLIKWLVGRSRPLLFAQDGAFAFQPLSAAHEHVGFPSGHATNVAALVTTMLIALPRRISLPAAILAILIGISRVVVGAHYPSDVIAGGTLGIVTTLCLACVFSRARCAFMRDPRGGLTPRVTAIRRTWFRGRLFRALLIALGYRGAPAP